LRLEGVTVHQVAQGVALSLLAFASFESSVFLGSEAKHPLKQMSRSITWSVVICGSLFVLFTYVLTIGFRGLTPGFAASPNPLLQIAQASGVGFINNVVQPSVIISLFGVTIANLNCTSRLLMTLSKEGLLPRSIGHVSAVTHTPSTAIVLLAVFDGLALTGFSLSDRATLGTYGFIGTLSGYWVGMTYVVTCIAMLLFLKRQQELTLGHSVIGLFAMTAFLYFFWTSAVPLPAAPGDLMLSLFFGSVALSIAHWGYLVMRRSRALAALGASASTATERSDL
jgi:amino acid transporter